MKTRLTLQGQIVIGVLVSVIMGWLFSSTTALSTGQKHIATPSLTSEPTLAASNTPAPPLTTQQNTPQPFVDLPKAWMVSFRLYRSAKPEILQVRLIDSGRLTQYSPGDSCIQTIDTAGKVLYEQCFEVVFTYGEPLTVKDSIDMVIVLPYDVKGKTIRIKAPQGKVEHDFQPP